jgi:hypothetical protein
METHAKHAFTNIIHNLMVVVNCEIFWKLHGEAILPFGTQIKRPYLYISYRPSQQQISFYWKSSCFLEIIYCVQLTRRKNCSSHAIVALEWCRLRKKTCTTNKCRKVCVGCLWPVNNNFQHNLCLPKPNLF